MWEGLAGRRLIEGATEVEVLAAAAAGRFHAPSHFNFWLPLAVDAAVMRGLAPDPNARYGDGSRLRDGDRAGALGVASGFEVADWVSTDRGRRARAPRRPGAVDMESTTAMRAVRAAAIKPKPKRARIGGAAAALVALGRVGGDAAAA